MCDCLRERPKSAKQFIAEKEAQFQKEKTDNKYFEMNDITRKGSHYYIREAWALMRQRNYKEKVFIFERLKRWFTIGRIANNRLKEKENEIEYRICYFIVGKKGKKRGEWTWGQYCPLIPMKDFRKLIKLAENKGVILH